jgi:hypothetical protein
MANPIDANNVVQWVGVPGVQTALGVQPGFLTARTDMTGAPPVTPPVAFNVKQGDDHGRLIVTNSGLQWEDVSNRTRSRSWLYSELKGVDRKENQIIVRPYHGDEYKFTSSALMDDVIYNAIADRIISARPAAVPQP